MPRQKYHVSQTLIFKQEDGKQNVFIRNEELGRGSFSIVYRVTHQYTNKIYAMKVISKKRCPQHREDLRNEIKIQQVVNHPNIVTLEYSFSDKRYHYFILEYCPGRTIREYLHRSKDNRLSEPITKKILKDVVQGLIYIHSHGITHYDIKLENFVIGSDGNVKIGDFGLSTFHEDEKDKKFSIFGTYNYLSPEMIAGGKREETSKVDIWALGVSAFFMLTGRQPFEGETKEITFNNISNVNYWFPNYLKISPEARNFIKSIFRLDPKKRPSACELFEHPFLADSENVCLYKTSSLPPLNMSPKPPTPNLCQSLVDVQKVAQKPILENLRPDLGKKVGDFKLVQQKPTTPNLKPTLCQQIADNKQVSPRPLTSNVKPNLCQPNDNKPASPKPTTTNLKQDLCPLNDNKQVSQKSTTPNLKPTLCQQIGDNKQVSPRPLTSNIKPNLCPLNDNKQDSQKPTTPNKKSTLCQPLGDNKQVSPRPITSNVKPTLYQPLGENKQASQKTATPNLKPVLRPLNDNKQVSPKTITANQNQSLCPPRVENEPISARRQNGNQNPTNCQPLMNNESVLPKTPTSNQNPAVCPPLSDIKQVSPRRQINNLRPVICTPITNNKPNTNLKSAFYPPNNINKTPSQIPSNNINMKPSQISPNNINKTPSQIPSNKINMKPSQISPNNINMKPSQIPSNNIKLTPSQMPPQNMKKPSYYNPRHVIRPIASKHQNNNTKQSNDSRPISATICILGDQIAFSPFSEDNSFIIPDYFVSRYSFINDNMSYLLANGTVGICFRDNSRIVMDPYERFVQFYENEETEIPDTVFLHEIDEEDEPIYVSLVKKAANHFKKIRFSYDLPECDYDSDDIMHNVICFVKNEDSILFKLDGLNFQINFNDNMKLIIFWMDKKLCFFKSIKEKCKLMDLNNASMNLNSDELMKFKNAKILLSDLSLTIC